MIRTVSRGMILAVCLTLCAAVAQAAQYASIVMDARTGKVIKAVNADTRVHPASLTKMMTLYIVFDEVQRGRLSLDQKVTISKHAASEPAEDQAALDQSGFRDLQYFVINRREIDGTAETRAAVTFSQQRRGVASWLAAPAPMGGLAYFSPRVQSRLVVESTGVRLESGRCSRTSTLTPRELDVLRHIARGLQKKEIASVMHVSVKTVGRHCENLMRKLSLHNTAEIAAYALRIGLPIG